MFTAPTSVNFRSSTGKKSLLSQSGKPFGPNIPKIALSLILLLLMAFWGFQIGRFFLDLLETPGKRIFFLYLNFILLFASLWQFGNVICTFFLPKAFILQMVFGMLMILGFLAWSITRFVIGSRANDTFWPMELFKCVPTFGFLVGLFSFCGFLCIKYHQHASQIESFKSQISKVHKSWSSLGCCWLFFTLHTFVVISTFGLLDFLWCKRVFSCKIFGFLFLIICICPVACILISSLNSAWNINKFMRPEVGDIYHLTPKLLAQSQNSSVSYCLNSQYAQGLFVIVAAELVTECAMVLLGEFVLEAIWIFWLGKDHIYNRLPSVEERFKQLEASHSLYWVAFRIIWAVLLGNLSSFKGSWRFWQNCVNLALVRSQFYPQEEVPEPEEKISFKSKSLNEEELKDEIAI